MSTRPGRRLRRSPPVLQLFLLVRPSPSTRMLLRGVSALGMTYGLVVREGKRSAEHREPQKSSASGRTSSTPDSPRSQSLNMVESELPYVRARLGANQSFPKRATTNSVPSWGSARDVTAQCPLYA